ncbi:Phage DNA packaging protein, Nu1 subunit of terminase [Oceanicella actignis]|uniref:Phage DNA packaging protein, Nu1 subunit of terminase n=1 Tax=Oceanicella actignis TaxID=1189325 RepID=A0A1M7U242_9RHOB|nr:Phage DNA packaging protein, Nu1 subunit of terminase [Oceanicella actignis]SHN76983.1 Phage DNA packaging protein, Nu1 subunit of terminase [Oceanicella actignis]
MAEYPLPAGVPDAVVNKYQLADALGKSQTTLDAWRRAGMPVESEGTNGRSYEFRLSVCFAWMAKRDAEEAAARLQAEGAAQQLRLALVGEDSAGGARVGLTPRQQREILELEHAYMIAARDRGELMRAEDVAEGIQDLLAAIRDGLDALPDRLGRECGLDGAAIEAAQRICDDVLDGARREILGMIGHAGAAAD